MKFNDLELSNWKELEINTDSLWLIGQRDKSGKHKNIYHGNFIPQIPNQLIRRYTKQGDTVFEPFMGSGTTLFECEKLKRKYIGIDINSEMIKYVNEQMQGSIAEFKILECNALNKQKVDKTVNQKVQFILMHPPYMNIVRFTNKPEDLSQIGDLKTFVQQFKTVCENSLKYLEKNRYFALVIGDIYKNSEVVPLGFYCMDMIKRNFKVKLKGTIVNNIENILGNNRVEIYKNLEEGTLC